MNDLKIFGEKYSFFFIHSDENSLLLQHFFSGDRYDGREQDTRKLSSQNDDFYNNNNNNGYGLNRVNGQNPTMYVISFSLLFVAIIGKYNNFF